MRSVINSRDAVEVEELLEPEFTQQAHSAVIFLSGEKKTKKPCFLAKPILVYIGIQIRVFGAVNRSR